MKLKVLLIVLLGVCDVALLGKMIWGPGGLLEYRQLTQRYADLKEQIVRLDDANMALSRDIRLLQSDSQFVEKMIRQKLRYLRDNELVYIFPGGNSEGGAANDSKN